jgi:uncharacterized protein
LYLLPAVFISSRPAIPVAGTLFKDEVYVPLLLFDEDGTAHGNDWARGFMRGMGMRHDGWGELVNDEEHGGCLIPMMTLCHEDVRQYCVDV